jgi:hypothetical protein
VPVPFGAERKPQKPPGGAQTTGRETRGRYIRNGGRWAASSQRPNRDTESCGE